MKIDLYTKGILTVIALSLVVIAFKDISPVNEAFAHDEDARFQPIIDCASSYDLEKAVSDIKALIMISTR